MACESTIVSTSTSTSTIIRVPLVSTCTGTPCTYVCNKESTWNMVYDSLWNGMRGRTKPLKGPQYVVPTSISTTSRSGYREKAWALTHRCLSIRYINTNLHTSNKYKYLWYKYPPEVYCTYCIYSKYGLHFHCYVLFKIKIMLDTFMYTIIS